MSTNETISSETCRTCKGLFRFRTGDGRVVNVLCGIPPSHVVYKCVSFVWGATRSIRVLCDLCGIETIFSVSNMIKFRQIIELVKTGNVWIDVLSIDQGNPVDVANQIPAMGQIYSNAACVSVLLPKGDEEAFRLLCCLSLMAKIILHCSQDFADNDVQRKLPFELTLRDIATSFIDTLKQFEKSVGEYKYWSRAWTFQEWTLARDIDLAVERTDCNGESHSGVKSSIFTAAALVMRYKILNGQYARNCTEISREQVRERFQAVRRLFPYEGYMRSTAEYAGLVEAQETLYPSRGAAFLLGFSLFNGHGARNSTLDRFNGIPIRIEHSSTFQDEFLQMLQPKTGLQTWPRNIIMGTVSAVRLRRYSLRKLRSVEKICAILNAKGASWLRDLGDELENGNEESIFNDLYNTCSGEFIMSGMKHETQSLVRRLVLMLNAFGASDRRARYDADLVCCWASMCNIQFEYDKHDTFTVALWKVLTILRQKGIYLFSFQVTTRNLEVDAAFLTYASEHRQCNSTAKSFMPGLPVFNGRTDTKIHLARSLHSYKRDGLASEIPGSSTTVQTVNAAEVVHLLGASQREQVIDQFRNSICNQFPYSSQYEGVDGEQRTVMLGADMSWHTDMDFHGAEQDVHELMPHIESTIQQVADHDLESKAIAFVSISLSNASGDISKYMTWGVVPSALDPRDLVVAKEELNNTLVLVRVEAGVARVLCYLVVTHPASGSYLIDCDDNGEVTLYLAKTQGIDHQGPVSTSGRIITGVLDLGDKMTAVSYLD